MKHFLTGCLLVISHILYAQFGCTDPQAINYNASATSNDGSCVYNPSSYAMIVQDSLPIVLSEISGMVYWNGKLYTHNDSGNPTNLFEIDTAHGLITKEIWLQGIANTDWEDITQDNTHFYIGDVGNNAGDRTNLKIYKFPKSAIGPNYYDTINANEIETIQFTYPDQVNFANNLYNTPFDCEAIAFKNNKLHLFTKNWTGGACVHYTLPNLAGTYIAQRLDSLNTGGILITAADFASNKQLMMLGYKNSGTASCAFWYVYDFNNSDSFFVSGNKRKIDLGEALTLGQIEGICFADSTHGYASNERFNPIAPVNVSAKLYLFTTTNWFPYLFNTTIDEATTDSLLFNVNVFNRSIQVSFTLSKDDLVSVSLYNGKGRKIRQKNYQLNSGNQMIQLDSLEIADGLYYVLFQNSAGLKKVSKIFYENR
ncbi:MAG: hypothetical protein IPI22_02330 [Bacteroidetes bacterium]|nr:hypothetical protein [Bacteroidota bacterium]